MGNLIGVEEMTQEQEFEALDRAYREAEREKMYGSRFDPSENVLYTVDIGNALIVAKSISLGVGPSYTLFEVSGGNGAKPEATTSESQAYRWAHYRNEYSIHDMHRIMEANRDW